MSDDDGKGGGFASVLMLALVPLGALVGGVLGHQEAELVGAVVGALAGGFLGFVAAVGLTVVLSLGLALVIGLGPIALIVALAYWFFFMRAGARSPV